MLQQMSFRLFHVATKATPPIITDKASSAPMRFKNAETSGVNAVPIWFTE